MTGGRRVGGDKIQGHDDASPSRVVRSLGRPTGRGDCDGIIRPAKSPVAITGSEMDHSVIQNDSRRGARKNPSAAVLDFRRAEYSCKVCGISIWKARYYAAYTCCDPATPNQFGTDHVNGKSVCKIRGRPEPVLSDRITQPDLATKQLRTKHNRTDS